MYRLPGEPGFLQEEIIYFALMLFISFLVVVTAHMGYWFGYLVVAGEFAVYIVTKYTGAANKQLANHISLPGLHRQWLSSVKCKLRTGPSKN